MNITWAPMVIVACVLQLTPGSAFAACETQGAAVCGPGSARVTSAGKLTVSRGGGFAPIASDAGVRSGDRILTGAAETTIALGATCRTTAEGGSLVSFTALNGRTCATVTGPAEADVTPKPERDRLPPIAIGVGVAAAAAVAVGIGLAVGGGGSKTSVTVSAQ